LEKRTENRRVGVARSSQPAICRVALALSLAPECARSHVGPHLARFLRLPKAPGSTCSSATSPRSGGGSLARSLVDGGKAWVDGNVRAKPGLYLELGQVVEFEVDVAGGPRPAGA
jgi:hypothetical protein